MNFTKIAAALHALADALDNQVPMAPLAAATLVAADPTPAPRRGRPPKGVEGAPAVATPAVAAVQTAVAATPTPATPAAVSNLTQAVSNLTQAVSNITHAALAPTFLAAAKTHGREFVIGVMKSFGAESFDKVPVAKLAEAKAAFERGPAAKPAVADGSDLLG